MNKNIAAIGRSYYEAMGRKDEVSIAKLLHEEVTFLSPVAEFKGRDGILKWVKEFLPNFESLTVHAVCSNENQAMVSYVVQFPKVEKGSRAAALLDITDGLITRIELFFDLSPFK